MRRLARIPLWAASPSALSAVLSSLFCTAVFCTAASCFAQAPPAPAPPSAVQPPASQHVVLTVQGTGSQIYRCQPNGALVQWVFQAPVARLFDAAGNEVGTHGDGPVWTYQDASSIQGALLAKTAPPDPADIPWLLLKGINPQRTGLLTTVEFISRTNTKGGVAPPTGCDTTHIGELSRIPYTASYTFYSSAPPKP